MAKKFKTYHNHRVEPYFTYVKNGQKTIEGRIKKGQYKDIIPGDHIVVHNESETDNIEVIVKDIRTYNTIKEMLSKENLKKILPDAKSIDHGVQIYGKFYSNEQEKEFGVVAIEVERIWKNQTTKKH